MEPLPPPIPEYRDAKPPPMPAGLTPEQIVAIREANVRAKKVRRAVSVAKTDASITAFFAVCGIVCFCLGWENTVMGALLGFIAWNSFRGANKLQQFDRGAPMLLAKNQAYLAGIIIVYAVFELIVHLTHSGTSSDLTSAGLSAEDIKTALGMDPGALDHLLAWTVYGLLIVGTIIFQGLTALYYKSRSKVLDEYLRDTPQWIVDFQAAQK